MAPPRTWRHRGQHGPARGQHTWSVHDDLCARLRGSGGTNPTPAPTPAPAPCTLHLAPPRGRVSALCGRRACAGVRAQQHREAPRTACGRCSRHGKGGAKETRGCVCMRVRGCTCGCRCAWVHVCVYVCARACARVGRWVRACVRACACCCGDAHQFLVRRCVALLVVPGTAEHTPHATRHHHHQQRRR